MIHAAQSVFIRTEDPTNVAARATFKLIRTPADDEQDRRSVYLYTVALEDTEPSSVFTS